MANKILITGADGFIGSHLTEYLLKKNYSITAFDRYNSFNSFGWLDNFSNKKLKCVLGDIRDFDSVNNVVKNHDIVIHLAALIGIPYSYISPSAYIKTNIEAMNPEKTTRFAFFCPYNSEIKSVTKNVNG